LGFNYRLFIRCDLILIFYLEAKPGGEETLRLAED